MLNGEDICQASGSSLAPWSENCETFWKGTV